MRCNRCGNTSGTRCDLTGAAFAQCAAIQNAKAPASETLATSDQSRKASEKPDQSRKASETLDDSSETLDDPSKKRRFF